MVNEIDGINETNKLNLTVPEEKIAQIITEFIGEKEKLIYEDNCYFTVELNDIIQFNHLIEQKISKEHNSHISFFSTEITYKNKTKRVFQSVESLRSYNEPNNLIPKSITLTWNIIFKFPDSKTIEAQKVRVFFNTTDDVKDGYVSLTIEHTNPSWGSEIQYLFTNHIKQLITKSDEDSKGYDSLMRSDGFRFLTYLVVIALFFFAFTYYLPGEVKRDEHKYIEQVYEISNQGKINDSELLIATDAIRNMSNKHLTSSIEKNIFKPEVKKIISNYMSQKDNNREYLKKYFWSGLFFFFASMIILRLYIKSYLNFYDHKSFLLITDYSKKKFDEHNKSTSKFQFYGLSTITFTIISGLATSFIFQVFNFFL